MSFDEKEYWDRVNAGIKRRQEEVRIRKERRRLADAVMPPPGSPPYMYRLAFTMAGRRPVSREEREDAGLTFKNRFALLDIDKPYSSIEEYARGVRLLEMRDARRKAFTRSEARVAVAPSHAPSRDDSGRDDGAAPAIGPWRQVVLPIDRDEWKNGYRIKTLPTRADEDRQLCERVLAKSPPRKRGRPPIGDKPMTGAERTRKYRERQDA